MKKILLFLMLFMATSVFAQDVIVKKDGSTILSKIIEIGTSEVKYKKYSNQNGPTYSIRKSEIQAINYPNGEKETFTENTEPQQRSESYYNNYAGQIANSMASSNNYQKEKLLSGAKSLRTAGKWICGIGFFGGTLVGVLIDDKIKDAKSPFDCGKALLCFGIGGSVGVLGAVLCNSAANNKERLANTITASHIIQQDFTIGNNRLSTCIDLMNDNNRKERTIGLGLCFNF